MIRQPTHSVTLILKDIQLHERAAFDDSAAELWRRYSTRLLNLVRARLASRLRRRIDAEDVIQSAFKSFCLRQRNGEFDLRDRNDLWALLVTMAMNKMSNAAKHHQRQKRNYRREQQEGPGHGDSSPPMLDRIASPSEGPDEALLMEEVVQTRLDALPENLRSIVLFKLAGYSNEEIAGKDALHCSVRTIERKVGKIRHIWQASEAPQT